MRETRIVRNTAETKIELSLHLDGGETVIETGCGFLDHMLTLFSRHGRFGLTVKCDGDTYVDYHHTVEDIGIVLGRAFRETLGDMKGILRYAHIILPMDEALVLAAVDISGRAHLSYDAAIPAAKVGEFDTELVKEFFLGFVRAAGITLHIRQMAGENSHHIIEGMFKAFGRIMNEATRIDEAHKDEIPSTKGMLV
ncbi:MAG: imidazoleglycerol-phosphate dehydratase HisB [Ruminococcaceae bacterium]|nr:imidazoleglycerol-phosphate dehydratase HisB [Oscillospiraceae bacterium]